MHTNRHSPNVVHTVIPEAWTKHTVQNSRTFSLMKLYSVIRRV